MKILPAIILLVANHFSTIVNVPSTLLGVLESTEKYRAKIFQDHFFQGTILYPSRWSLQNRQKHTKFKDTKIKTLRTAKNLGINKTWVGLDRTNLCNSPNDKRLGLK